MKTPMLAAVLLALCLPAMAQSSSEQKQTKAAPNNIVPSSPQAREKQEKERQEREKRLGSTPEGRQAKILEHEQYIEKRRGELEKKRIAGTLTPQESKMLQQIEGRKPRVEKVKETEPSGRVNKSGPRE